MNPKICYLTTFWAFLYANGSLEYPKSDKNVSKIWKNFKNIQNFPTVAFHTLKPTINYHKLHFSKISWFSTPKICYFDHFLAFLYANDCLECPRSCENVKKFEIFFKNIQNFPRIIFETPKHTRNHRTSRFSKISWFSTPKIGYFKAFWAIICPPRMCMPPNPG